MLGADTDVVIDGQVLGKPESEVEAEERLRLLSGRSHEVIGGVCLLDWEGEGRVVCERTTVTFTEIGRDLMITYIESGEWRDRAGGYAVQGLGSCLIERIDGDLSNVIGLPVRALLELEPDLLWI